MSEMKRIETAEDVLAALEGWCNKIVLQNELEQVRDEDGITHYMPFWTCTIQDDITGKGKTILDAAQDMTQQVYAHRFNEPFWTAVAKSGILAPVVICKECRKEIPHGERL